MHTTIYFPIKFDKKPSHSISCDAFCVERPKYLLSFPDKHEASTLFVSEGKKPSEEDKKIQTKSWNNQNPKQFKTAWWDV